MSGIQLVLLTGVHICLYFSSYNKKKLWTQYIAALIAAAVLYILGPISPLDLLKNSVGIGADLVLCQHSYLLVCSTKLYARVSVS